jgi:branched-chain amino acid transport system substrate-binding protein
MQLAVDSVNEDDNLGPDGEVRIEFGDTETSPDTGRQRASEFIDDGADVLAGSLSDATAQSIGELAQREELVYMNLGGSNEITGENCLPASFVAASSAHQQSHGAPRYVMAEGLGESIYTIAADYSWGQGNRRMIEEEVAPEFDVEYVGNTFTQLGQGDFSQAITTARESEADIVNLIHFGGEMVQTAKQADEFGLLDDKVCVWPLTGLDEASQLSTDIISHENFYAGSLWYWGFQDQSDDAADFVEAFQSEYETAPTGAGGCMFTGLRTVLEAVGEAGTDGDPLRKAIEGRQLTDQIWGEFDNAHFRACDHSLVFPTPTLKGRSNPEGQDYFEVLDIPDDPEAAQSRPCDETGCDMPDSWSG